MKLIITFLLIIVSNAILGQSKTYSTRTVASNFETEEILKEFDGKVEIHEKSGTNTYKYFAFDTETNDVIELQTYILSKNDSTLIIISPDDTDPESFGVIFKLCDRIEVESNNTNSEILVFAGKDMEGLGNTYFNRNFGLIQSIFNPRKLISNIYVYDQQECLNDNIIIKLKEKTRYNMLQ